MTIRPVPNNLTSGSVAASFLRLGVPTAIGLMFSTLYNIVDAYYAGLLGTSEQAGIAIGFQAFILFLAFGYGTGGALSSVVGLAKGAKSDAEVKFVTLQGLFYISMMCFVLLVIGWLTGAHFIELATKDDPYRDLALRYFLVMLLGLPGFLLAYAGNGILHAFGDSLSLTRALFLAFLANAGFTPLLIYGVSDVFQGIGFWGIPVMTVLSQSGVGLYVMIQIFRRPELRENTDNTWRPDLGVLRQIGWQALPSSCVFMISFLSGFVVQFWLKDYGEEAQAAYGITLRVQQLFLLPIIGLTIALVPIAAQNLGAEKFSRVRKAFGLCVTFGFLVAAIAFPIFWVFGTLLATFFSSDPKVTQAAALFLRFEGVSLPLYVLIFSINSVLQALHKAIWTLAISIYRQVFALILFIWLFSEFLDWAMLGVYMGVLASTLTGTLFAFGIVWRTVPKRLLSST